jgi:carbon storage regulator
MLILSRNPSQEIVIGNNIVVRVVQVRGNRVKLAVEAPKDVRVNRREIYDALKQEGDGE